ncbi:carotenoid biosynthesis protein [uncultured Draconibacterium sp.]|uniref:carotenoid biosynthesis protein n=1 Tax=uncultured Draconibacterium sp. TaxID=1573823 RepID=UPI0025EC2F34|nr:carotenoid biosynthesis protein [uncultured Draconibacterium sp.]
MINPKKIAATIQSHFNYVVFFLVVFYTVGVLGLSLSASQSFFIRLTPFALLLSSFFVAFFHATFSKTTVLIFLLIYVLSFFIELIGVQTGIIFGEYKYGHGLGIKVANTPLIIGLNWLLLVYTSNAIMQQINCHPLIKVTGAASLLLLYDILLEQVAPKIAMWSFSTANIPLQNYLVWFLLGLSFSALLHLFRINTKNKIAPYVFVIQAVFFLLLLLTLN